MAFPEKLHSQAHNDPVFLYAFDLLVLGRRRPAAPTSGGAQGQAS
jgi:hypothetical protein